MTSKTELALKFKTWDSAIRKRVLERNKEARGLVIAVLAKAHHLQLGPPGTAKSYLVDSAMKLVGGANTMRVQLHGYSVMEDMYGPVSMKGLGDDKYMRKYETYVPWADFVFADEVFKANPTLLNTNLMAFNERQYRHDGEIIDIPLISAFFASNEGPDDSELAAFDDRIHMRFSVGPIKEPATRLKMFRLKLTQQENPEPVLSIGDIREAIECVRTVEVPDRVLETLNTLQEELKQEQIVPTDRKFNDSLRVIQATAFFNGRETATNDDLGQLANMFWTEPKDAPIVLEKVLDLGSPLDKKASVLLTRIEALATQVEDVIGIEAKPLRTRKSMTIHEKLTAASHELRDLKDEAKQEGISSEILNTTRQRLNSTTVRLLERGFRHKPGDSSVDEKELREMIQESQETAE